MIANESSRTLDIQKKRTLRVSIVTSSTDNISKTTEYTR